MNSNQTFFHNVEARYRKKCDEDSQSIASLQAIMREKHALENTHNNIVKKASNPYLNQNSLKSDKNLSKSTDFMVKKVHHVYCPAIPNTEKYSEMQSFLDQPIPYQDNSIISQIIPPDINFDTTIITENEKLSYTSIFYVEDLFKINKNSFATTRIGQVPPRISRIKMQSNFNNSYTRKIAGSSVNVMIHSQRDYIDDPLKMVEAKLPKRFRSTLKKSDPWIYSSIPRTNTIFKVKCRSRFKN